MNKNTFVFPTKESIYILKACAIFSVICAHCNAVNENNSFLNVEISYLLKSIGTIGVFIFYFLAGYFFCLTKRNVKEFWKQKFFSVITPWLLCGTGVYLYDSIRTGTFSLIAWIKWLLGINTYLYYVVVLLFFYFVLYPLRKNKNALIVLLIISLLENVILYLIPTEVFTVKYPYLDPLRFGYMFLFGLLSANIDLLPKMVTYSRKFIAFLSIAWVALLVIPRFFSVYYEYFVLWYIPFAILSLLFGFGISQCSKGKISLIVENIGRWSYGIYLLHMPVAGAVAYLCKRVDNPLLTLARPMMVLIVVYVFFAVVSKISSYKRFKAFNILFGLR